MMSRSSTIIGFLAVRMMVCLVTVTAWAGYAAAAGPRALPVETLRLSFEDEADLLADFVSQSPNYVHMGLDGLEKRDLAIEPGRFGNGLHIRDGWPISQGTWNESGLDCDLIVAVMWGEFHKKPHFWGQGRFHGGRGTVAFWVKSDAFHPGAVFMQSNIAWGRKERDLFAIEVDVNRRLSAYIRDVYYDYHRVTSDEPIWVDGQWQHITVTYDRGYGLKLYHNGQLVGSTWNQDAWWQTPLPGLFSPFLPESVYDEIVFLDRPLSDGQVASLYERNVVDAQAGGGTDLIFDEGARNRLLAGYADLDSMDLPTLTAGQRELRMKQTVVEDCHDEKVPAWWVLDGRYELAWPHPYLMFTFVLGDVDFHGTKVDIDLAAGETPNYISFEGIFDDMKVLSGKADHFEDTNELVSLKRSDNFFYSQKIDMAGGTALRIPLLKSYGSPPGLQGSAKLPLTGKTRIHELNLWDVRNVEGLQAPLPNSTTAYLRPAGKPAELGRYGPALAKLMSSRDRTFLLGDWHFPARADVTLYPLNSLHLFGTDLNPDMAVDAVGLRLLISPNASSDVLWIKLRDPAHPSRIWAQTCIRVKFNEADGPQPVHVKLDIIDMMLAGEDRMWVEIMSANGGQIILGDTRHPSSLVMYSSTDRQESLAAYVKHEMIPARMQYMKEYNYLPWRWMGKPMSIQHWSHFGGPFNMVYPVLATLRHDPGNRLGHIFRELTLERWGAKTIAEDSTRRPVRIKAPPGAPAWAVWQRELYALNLEIAHWIASRQRRDGFFWGGCNDDPFLIVGYAGLPLMGDEITRKAWLRFYDGLEKAGIYADGYCDIRPIDPLHITDFISGRGLMLAYALGDPNVLEREMQTARRYTAITEAHNAKRLAAGLERLTGDWSNHDQLESTPTQQMEAIVANYSCTHVKWYWGKTEKPKPHVLKDRAGLARSMMNTVLRFDETTRFFYTRAMVHTDCQGGGIGRDELIAAMLGGRLQAARAARPNSIAVSWQTDAGADLARLVSYADDREIRVSLYNFTNEPAVASIRTWRLGSGLYEINMGPDTNDDGMIDDNTGSRTGDQRTKQPRELRRFSTLPVTVPPGQYVLSVRQIKAISEPEALPDLAVSQRSLRAHGNDTVNITVHNIGAAPARNVTVELVDRNGRVVASRTIEQIDSPSDDLQARKATLEFKGLGDPAALSLRVRCADGTPEILDENNTVSAW